MTTNMVLMKRGATAATSLLLLALAAFLLMPRLNEATSRAVSEGLRGFRERLEGALGLTISFDSLSPSILRSASFSGLSISAPGGRILLSARKVRVRYDLLAVLRGRSSEALTGLELEDVTLDFRFPEDKAVWDRLRGLSSAGSGGGAMPKLLVSGRNVSASLSLEGLGLVSFDAREVGFSTVEAEPAISLDGRFSLDLASGGLGRISGPLSLSGSLARDFRQARLGLAIAADSRDFSLSTQRFELVYGEGQLSLTKVRDRAPLDAEIRVDFAGGESSIVLRLDGFAPSKSLKLSGRYASIEPWLEIPYSGSIAAKAPALDLSRAVYDIRLAGLLPARLFQGDKPAVSADIAMKGDFRSVAIEKARVERGSDSLEYSGSFRFGDLAPDGVLGLRLSLTEGNLGIASSVRLVGNGGEYAAMADSATIGGTVFTDLSLAAARKGSLADFNLSFRPPASAPSDPDLPVSRFSGEAGAEGGASLVRCEGSVSLDSNPSIELSVDLETIDLGPLKPLLTALTGAPEAAAVLSSLKLGGALFATSDFKRVSWSAPDLTVVSSSVPGAYALLSLSGTAKTLAVKNAIVSASGYSVVGSGKVDFSEPGKLGFEATIALKDIPYAMKGVVLGQGISISGDYGLELTARAVGADTFVSAKSRGLPLPLGGGLFLATVDAEGRFATLQDWELSVAEFDLVPTGESVAVLPKVELAGEFGPGSASLDRLRVEDRLSAVSGKADLSYSLSQPMAAKISTRLTAVPDAKAAASLESYSIEASYSGGKVEGAVDFVASPLARLGKLPIQGLADGRVAVKGELSDPSVDFRLKLRDGRYLDQTLALGASGSLAGGFLLLRDVAAAYQGQSISGGTARFSLSDASASVGFSYAGTIVDEQVKFAFSAQGAPTRAGAAGAGKVLGMLADYRAEGVVSDFSMGTVAVARWPVYASSDSGSLLVVGGESGELRFKSSAGGSFSASLREPFPVRADASCLFDGKNLDLSVQGIEFDLGLLAPLMPPSLIKIVSGKARGGFRAMGLANDPEITGEIDLQNASLKVLGWLGDEVGPFKAPIVALGRKISISVPAAKAGKASLALDCQATFDHWLPTGLTASVKTLERSRVALDSSILGISAKGDAAADLKFALQGDVLALDCDVTLDKGTVVVSTAILASGGAPAPRPSLFLQVAAKVRFGRKVEVFFPSSDFPIVAGFSDPSSLLNIRYDQASEDFALKGNVALRGGEVFYIQRNFFLKNGSIVFNEGNDRFEPRVTILAELRDRTNDGDPVLITLRADNAPISSFKPRLSSDPVMTESQIAMLMGQNLVGASADNQVDLRTAVISVGVPQLNVTRILEDKVRDAVGLDMLYLRTQVLQKWLIDISGPSSAASGDTMGRYLDQSELYMGKYISDSIFAHGSARLREDPLAGANKLVIDSELGLELDSPFGLIKWNIAPKSWDNLLINDQSLSLSWKLSY